MEKMGRHEQRQAALQILFAVTGKIPDDSQLDMAYDMVLDGREYDSFLPQLINGVIAARPELDKLIDEHLANGWQVKRITRVDLVILELALYEITYLPEQPYRVAVDEAIELAKEYAGSEDAKFINGVLKNFAPNTLD
ncbi:transcription antitermination factor NusB [Eupransor demetentiae]|uniref:Transcription antitermination protein NusB n=1 Tax=Eupransor demetentiae TaxID=3109584 RepID=A0ABP0EMV0_9LACO|nr:Transcription antitermination protein NusB (NusB) [Lactobacillaceae bacterium LMG 33000]